MTVDFAFFGCWREAGHFLWGEGKKNITDPEAVGLIKPEDLDGSRLFLPYPELIDTGCLTHLPALDLMVMSWWNRSYDSRGGVNSHLLVRGSGLSAATMWRVFVYRFKEVAEHHRKPLIRLPI